MSKQKITGVILAGGKNSRMGTDKGLLRIEGKKIIERILDAMKPVVNEIIIISNGDNYDYLGYKIYNDIVRDCGPMGGIHTALSYSKTEKNLIVSCDMPFLTSDTLKYIVENSDGCEVAVPQHNERTEPLCSVYTDFCRNKFSQLLGNGEWKMKDALKHFNVKRIVFQNGSEAIKIFSNINSKEEYRNLFKKTYEHTS